MNAKHFYIVLILISALLLSLSGYALYEDNFLNDKKNYQAVIVEKYINNNTDGGAYVLKLKFKWKEDSIIDKGTVGEKQYNTYKINDTMSIYYNPTATFDRVIFINTLEQNNLGGLAFIAILIMLIIFSVYKFRHVSKDALIE